MNSQDGIQNPKTAHIATVQPTHLKIKEKQSFSNIKSKMQNQYYQQWNAELRELQQKTANQNTWKCFQKQQPKVYNNNKQSQ